jgi:hypothetical protein
LCQPVNFFIALGGCVFARPLLIEILLISSVCAGSRSILPQSPQIISGKKVTAILCTLAGI